jgi:dTDP-4-amino-4,6-dideoxygalactose transaminase
LAFRDNVQKSRGLAILDGMMTSNADVPLVDLKAQYRTIFPEIDSAIRQVIDRADFILGADVDAFEEEFAAFCGVRNAVGCGSGTEALTLAMAALGVGPGDEVILPAMTFIATALAVTRCGARPVLADVDPQTALIDPAAVAAAITSRTKAIVPVHLYGQCADITEIGAIARRSGLLVVEDAAQAHGATHAGVRAGALGDAGCFSFYPGKNLGAYGDAGAVTTNDDAIADRLRRLRNWGGRIKHRHDELGINSRLDTLQAAVLRAKLRHLDRWNEARRRHAADYDRHLSAVPELVPARHADGSVFHLYVARSTRRDEHVAALNRAGIGAAVHYPFAIHEHRAYAGLGHKAGAFPHAERWARTCLSLPIYPEMPASTPGRVAAVLSHAAAAAA